MNPNPLYDHDLAREMLTLSGLIDHKSYRSRAQLPEDQDPIDHYLNYGWKQGLEPCDGFDSVFLRPYYEAAGYTQATAITWLTLLARQGRRPPRSLDEATWFAEQIRHSPFFDSTYYSCRLPDGVDPALHYVVIGELLGWKPSHEFDPDFYLAMYPDIASNGLSPLGHHTTHGHREGRRIQAAADRLDFPKLYTNHKPVVVVVVHEASRTGAPLLGWSIVKHLSDTYDIVSVLMRGGDLETNFREDSAVTVGPMVWEEWNTEQVNRVAERIISRYRPTYVIINSIETRLMAPAFAARGVPVVALVHEFASYTRPLSKMKDVFDWASHIVFPAHIVAQSSFTSFPSLARRRGVHILAQGPVAVPGSACGGPMDEEKVRATRELEAALTEVRTKREFLVIGLGTIQLRKGVDLFIAAANTAVRLAPGLPFKFIFVGDGYDPVSDWGYSVYLAEQIVQSGLEGRILILNSVEDLDPIYSMADVFFMSSRLDPQPNVGIDAVTRGIPTVCFRGACGTAEVLSTNQLTRTLVVPHLDTHMAGEAIVTVAQNPDLHTQLRHETANVGLVHYNMGEYVKNIDAWGKDAVKNSDSGSLKTLIDAQEIDPDLALPKGAYAPGNYGLEQHVLQQWAIVGLSPDQASNNQFRRPLPGFHPQVYAHFHQDACVLRGANPLAHWIRSGRPDGPWIRQVFTRSEAQGQRSTELRVALHGHFYYLDAVPDLLRRLALNTTICDLILTTNTISKAERLRLLTADYQGKVDIRVMPNSGRDIGPLLTGLATELRHTEYHVIGHIHGKQSIGVDSAMGDVWRDFLWSNLIGDFSAMLDIAVGAFERHPEIGLIIPEDPHLVGWDENREIATDLAMRMGIDKSLPDFFDFPLGTMFWARPAALTPLFDLGLTWGDYPAEPLPNDGTLLHALERLIPMSAEKVGFAVAGIRADGTTW